MKAKEAIRKYLLKQNLVQFEIDDKNHIMEARFQMFEARKQCTENEWLTIGGRVDAMKASFEKLVDLIHQTIEALHGLNDAILSDQDIQSHIAKEMLKNLSPYETIH